jgi:hypothetical protein
VQLSANVSTPKWALGSMVRVTVLYGFIIYLSICLILICAIVDLRESLTSGSLLHIAAHSTGSSVVLGTDGVLTSSDIRNITKLNRMLPRKCNSYF